MHRSWARNVSIDIRVYYANIYTCSARRLTWKMRNAISTKDVVATLGVVYIIFGGAVAKNHLWHNYEMWKKLCVSKQSQGRTIDRAYKLQDYIYYSSTRGLVIRALFWWRWFFTHLVLYEEIAWVFLFFVLYFICIFLCSLKLNSSVLHFF